MNPSALDRPVFLFDADCGVCQNSTQIMRKRINPPVDFRPYQSFDYSVYGITETNLGEGPILLLTDSTFLIGPPGMATLLTLSTNPYRLMGRAMLLPGVKQFLAKIGPHLYAQRKYLPGASGSCAIDPR